MPAPEAGFSLYFSSIHGIADGERLTVDSLHRHPEFHNPAYSRIERLNFPLFG